MLLNLLSRVYARTTTNERRVVVIAIILSLLAALASDYAQLALFFAALLFDLGAFFVILKWICDEVATTSFGRWLVRAYNAIVIALRSEDER